MNTDFIYSVGADTRQLDRAIADTSKNAESAFGKVGSSIEKKTEGLRKFQGALSSTIGIATGLVGVFGAVAGAAFGAYKAYEEIAGAAERIAEANRLSNRQTREAIGLARQRVQGEEDFLRLLKDRNTAGIDARIEQIRARQAVLTETSFGRTMTAGMTEVLRMFGADLVSDPNMAEFANLERDVADLERARGEISRSTELKAAEDITLELKEQEATLQRQLHIAELRSQGRDEEARKLEAFAKHQQDITALEDRYIELQKAGLDEQAAAIAGLIRLKNEALAVDMEAAALAARAAEAEKRRKTQEDFEGFKSSVMEQLFRARGQDDFAEAERITREMMDLRRRLEQFAGTGVSFMDAMGVEAMIDELAALREGAIGQGELQAQRLRFGASVAGNVGAGVGAQVLGGTGNMMQQLDQKRNTTLASMDSSLKALVRASNSSGGNTAVFA